MHIRAVIFSFFLVGGPVFFSTLQAGSLATFKVSFQTLSCDGARGFATVDADRVFKVESIPCDSGDPVKEVFQVLVNGAPGSGSGFDVFTTSEKEAEKIMEAVGAYQEDKRIGIREGQRIIVDQ